jgi:phosphoglycerate dehydrogenase-like enzyme
MREFRVALTGDFLGADGRPVYGDPGLAELGRAPYVQAHFVTDLAPRPGDESYWSRLYSLEVRPEHIARVDGLIVLRPWVKAATLAAGGGRLVVIGRSGAGYDKIDLAACTAHDVAVFNVPGVLNHSTASTALMFMLALAKRLPAQDRITRQGRWDLQAAVTGHEIEGRTLSIVGLGQSGRELARLAAPFNMRMLAYSPHADPAQAASLGVRLVSLEVALSEADFLCIHAHLTPDKRGMIGAREIALMKPGAYLINVARGEIVDQAALVAALQEERIAGAALDVYEHEPLPADDPLLRLGNVILTPHWSASTSDVFRGTARATASGMLRAAQGLVPEHVVNPEVLDRPTFLAKLAHFAENRVTADTSR